MGARDSKPCSITNEDASKRVTESELKRLRDAFKRASNLSGIITRQAFIKEVLGEFVPLKLAEHIFQACGGTSKGITFKDLLCGLVLLTRGTREERIRFIFNLYANEGGTHIYKNDMIKLVLACDGGFIPEAVADCFLESEKVTFEEFQEWLLQHPDATSLTRWLLNEPSSVTLSNDLETPTFYQTLAGVTHLEETDIIELEKRYWQLKTQSRTGRFDLDMLGPLISPPVPPVLCQGIFNAFDENRDNHIDFKEMACGVSACCRGPLAERQKFCFKVFDQDMDGMLSREEVSHMLTLLMVLQQEERSDELFQMQMAPARPDVGPLIDEVFDKHDPGKTGVITLDEYLVWTVGNNLTISLLNLMFQVCHVVFGLRPSSREEEGDIVRSWLRREERRGLKPGQMLYLISMDWWRSWNDYVDCKAAGSSAASCGVSGVKVTSRLQRKVESSVARSATDDGSVVLASVTSLAPDGHHLLDPVTPFEAAVNCPSVPGSPKCPRLSATLQCPESSCPSSLNPSPSVSRKVVPTFVQRPPSIDNTGLVAPSTVKAAVLTGEGGRLVRPLSRGRDFEAVPEAVWRALFQWYGGSPALPRQCIVRGGTGAGHHPASTELELYPPCLRLWRHQPPQGAVGGARQQNANSWTAVVGSVASAYVGGVGPGGGSQASGGSASPKRFLAYQASFSRTSTLRQVFDFLCTRLRLRPEDTRLWQLQDESNLTPLEEESLTLEQLGIEDGEQILIEVRNKDQTWPEEMSCIINSKIDQKNQGPTEKGATGLNNLGNTCFMNAALQCVSNTRPLTQYFINEKHLYELNRINPLGMKGHIAKRYGDLVHDLWSGTSKTVAPLKLRWTIGKYAPRFNGFQQHDSQELLAFLLDGLHEDLNRVQEKPYVELKDSAGRPDDEVAREAWENHALRNRSVVVDLFHGQLQSTVTCKVCGHTSVRFDPFNFLSLPLPMESCVHVEVVVVRLDGSVPVRYGLQLNPDERYASLKQQLAPLCGLCPQQLLLAEVWGAVVRALLPDDRRVQATTGGAGLYAYQLLQASDHSSSAAPSADDEGSGSCWAPPHVREPQTLTQIQRMVVTCANGPQLPSGGKPLVNGSLPSGDGGPSSLCGPPPLELGVVAAAGGAGEASSCQVTTVGLFCCSRLGGSRCGPRPLSRVGQGNDGLPERPDTPGSTSSGSAVTSGSWNGVGPYAELSSGMSSSLTSNCSAADLSDLPRRNFVVAYHRKMMRQDVYFLSSQKTRPTLFGLPLVLPCHEGTSRQDLYRLVWTQVARLVSPLPPSEATVPNHAQDCDDSLGYEYPFTLKAVHKDGFMCAWCPWYKFCRGCPIDCDDADFNFSSLYLSIDWDPTALHLRYQASQERVYVDHPSVERTRQQKVEPISVHDCLAAFTKEEQLGDREKYHCSRCKQHQLATKKLQIYRLPPILIIHLKRFQLLGGKWVKSQKIVRFPFKDFDPTDYLSPVPRKAALSFRRSQQQQQQPPPRTASPLVSRRPDPLPHRPGVASPLRGRPDVAELRLSSVASSNSSASAAAGSLPRNGTPLANGDVADAGGGGEPQDHHKHRLHPGYSPLDLKYQMYALACHTGILGGGHYVSYACNPNNKWYCYNDSSCKEVQLDQIDSDSAYMLFYEREGINYEAYMPNTEGKVPDARDIDDEFESDFRKMCVLQ
ncbi:ubiquitin specific protease 32 isoform X2 [Haemaphysalis longicornis]